MMRLSDRRFPKHRRIQKDNQHNKSHPYLAFAAFTIAGMYVFSPTAAFTSSGARLSIDKSTGRISPSPSSFPNSLLPPFGISSRTPSLFPETRLYSTNDNDSDREEWRAILAAFTMYKAAFGDLKIPLRFVVPSMPPWPEAAWDMKLGKIVGAIRATGKYVDNNERRRKQLDKLGFVWRVRAATKSAKDNSDVPFEQIYEALLVYRKEVHPVGPFSVPLQYTTPDSDPWPENTRGMPLGRYVANFGNTKFLKENPEAEQKLSDIGFELNSGMTANDIRFQNVYTALERYKEIYGDLLVPQPFEVPTNTDDWPEPTWGLRLGARVNAIRSQGTFIKNDPSRRGMLDELGFVWSPPESERRRRGRKSKAEIEEEMKRQEASDTTTITTTTDVESETQEDPQDVDSFMSSFDFSGSNDTDGPVSRPPIWGFEGGQGGLQDSFDATQEESAKNPATDEYRPPKTLGESLSEARDRAIEVGIVEEGEGKTLRKGKQPREIAWFNDDFGGFFVFDDVVEALTLYKEFYGNFANLTDEAFVIPAEGEINSPFDEDEDDGDDMEMQNDPTAQAAAAIARFEEFEDLYMSEDAMELEISKLENVISPELETEETATTAVASQVQVDWPDHLGGMRLGNIVTRIRDGSLEVKHLPERKAKLDAIDFDWGDPKYFIDVPFEKAMCAMYAYYLVRGDMFVPSEFIMPDEDPWPKSLAGYEIGQAVKRLRELQNFLEAYHSEKVSLLRMIDFVWFPTLALPLDPTQGEMTPEILRLSAFGHPDYSKMLLDIPMGLHDKIIADGPYFETDDPKLWWRTWHDWDHVADIWYQRGRRDNAWILRGMGYPTMADEHEAKYGPGLFTQIQETLSLLGSGKKLEGKEKDDVVEKLNYYREELVGCMDIDTGDSKRLIQICDEHLVDLLGLRVVEEEGAKKKGKRKGKSADEILQQAAPEQDYEVEEVEIEEVEEDDYEVQNGEMEEVSEDYEYEYEYEEEEVDIEEELGLDSSGSKS